MAMMGSGGSGYRTSYSTVTRSYTPVTKSYTLADAIRMASAGGLDAELVYRQLPEPLKRAADRKSWPRLFLNLSSAAQQKVMAHVEKRLQRLMAEAEKPLSLPEALKRAAKGKLEADHVYRQLPDPLKREADQESLKFSKPFLDLTSTDQRRVLARVRKSLRRLVKEAKKPITLLEALKRAARGEMDETLVFEALPEPMQKLANALAEAANQKQFSACDTAGKRRVLGLLVAGAPQEPGSCERCGERLSFFSRLFRRKAHGTCLLPAT